MGRHDVRVVWQREQLVEAVKQRAAPVNSVQIGTSHVAHKEAVACERELLGLPVAADDESEAVRAASRSRRSNGRPALCH